MFRSNSKRSSGTISTVSVESNKSDDESKVPEIVEFAQGQPLSSLTESESLMTEGLLEEAKEAQAQGDYRLCLELYQKLIQRIEQHETGSEVVLANLSYTCSRLARRLGDFPLAYRHAQDELRYTQQCSSPGCVTSDQYCDLAEICQYGLGDSKTAMTHYKTALALEEGRLHRIRKTVRLCPRCKSHKMRDLCSEHAAEAMEIHEQMKETKQCIGRIHFELGNVAEALRML